MSKSVMTPIALMLLVITTGCTRLLPWNKEPAALEVNMAFQLRQNVVELQTLRINNKPGRFILGSAAPRTILDSRFPAGRKNALQISERETVRLLPAKADLKGVVDGIIGVEAWGNRAITIDYHTGLVTYQKEGIHPGLMKLYEYEAEPMVYVSVNGSDVPAIVDTSSPDTLILPAAKQTRGRAHVVVSGVDFGNIDVQYAKVSQARIGNRLLADFLVTIDYGKRVVGLWHDPRNRVADLNAKPVRP